MFTKIFQWIWYSSADASKTSLTVKSVGLGIIPWAIQAVGLSCGFNLVCPNVDAASLQGLVESAANLVFLALSTIAAIGATWGAFRKVLLTATGNAQTI